MLACQREWGEPPGSQPTSWSALESSAVLAHYDFVTFYRRRLPHLYQIDQPIFLTWRLYGSLPAHCSFTETTVNSGKAFATLDRLLENTRTGPFYLRQPAIADMVVEVLYYNAHVLCRHTLHAFVVMPNHVHLLMSIHVSLPQITKALKGYTAKRANQMLTRTGNPFWQEETYDHLVRGPAEQKRIRLYIEQNPVRAGLVREADEYRWSSAGWATRRSPAGPEAHPTVIY
jgi:putative transposase